MASVLSFSLNKSSAFNEDQWDTVWTPAANVGKFHKKFGLGTEKNALKVNVNKNQQENTQFQVPNLSSQI